LQHLILLRVALDRVSFFHDGIQHDVCIYADKSGEESIYKRPYSPVTDLEIKSWLDANAGGQSWIEVKPQPEFTKWLIVERSWRRTDGAIASIEGPKAKPRLLFHIKAKALIDAQKVEL
jgi:hypothetical protein